MEKKNEIKIVDLDRGHSFEEFEKVLSKVMGISPDSKLMPGFGRTKPSKHHK